MKTVYKTGIIVFALLFAACSGNKESETSGSNNTTEETLSTDSIEATKEYPVRTKKLENTSIERTLDLTADLLAYKTIDFAPASPGRIDKINVEIGSKVKKGDVLVETDKTQLTQAYTQLQSARDNYNRFDTLYKLGSISEQQLEQVKTQYELAQTNVKYLVENTTLRSPIDGIVTGKYFEAGEMYSAVPNTVSGKAAVVSLMQTNPMKAVVSVSESYYPLVKDGMKATIACDVLNKDFIGKIHKIYPTINKGTRTFQVEITVDNNSGNLIPGMFSRIAINLGNADALVVPSISVLKQEGTNNRYVFLYDNGKAKQVLVQIGKRFDDLIEIISPDIHQGQELIVEGQANLLNGSKVIKK